MQAIVILYPDCIFFEVAGAISLLSQNCGMIMASPDGRPVRVGEQFSFEANLSYVNYTKPVRVKQLVMPPLFQAEKSGKKPAEHSLQLQSYN